MSFSAPRVDPFVPYTLSWLWRGIAKWALSGRRRGRCWGAGFVVGARRQHLSRAGWAFHGRSPSWVGRGPSSGHQRDRRRGQCGALFMVGGRATLVGAVGNEWAHVEPSSVGGGVGSVGSIGRWG